MKKREDPFSKLNNDDDEKEAWGPYLIYQWKTRLSNVLQREGGVSIDAAWRSNWDYPK